MPSECSRRQQILDAAERLLRHYGPGKTTMAEIAREATVGVGTVYLEFNSKDAIIEELSRARHGRVLRAMRDAASVAKSTYDVRLRAVLDAKVNTLLCIADEGAHGADLVHCGQMAVKTAETRFRSDEQDFLATLLADATRAGEFDVTDPAAIAATLLRAYAPFSPPWIFGQSRDEIMQSLARMHDLVLRGLLRRPPPRARR